MQNKVNDYYPYKTVVFRNQQIAKREYRHSYISVAPEPDHAFQFVSYSAGQQGCGKHQYIGTKNTKESRSRI